MRPLLTFSLVLSAGAALANTAATTPAPLTVETMWALERLAPPALSPDGRHAVVPVTRFDVKDDRSFTDLWLVATDGSEQRPLTTHIANDNNPVFSPDGRWLAFIAQRDEDKAPQLYLLPMAGGEARRLTNVPTGVAVPKWFGDSKRIAFVTRVWPGMSWDEMGKRLEERAESKMTARVWDGVPVTYWDTFIDERQAHVYSVAIDGGEVRPHTLDSGLELPRSLQDAGSYDFNPVTGQLAFVADSDPAASRTNLDLFLLADDGKTVTNLSAPNPGADTTPLWSPDGKKLAFAQQTIPGFYADQRRLMLWENGQTRRIAADWDRSAEGLVWKPDGSGFYGAIDDASVVRVYDIPLTAARPRAVTGAENVSGLALSRGPKPVLVGLNEAFDRPPTLVRIDPKNGQLTALGDFNRARLAEIRFGRYESVTYRGANDAAIQMWVVYPPDFDPNKKWPVMLLLHGGPHNAITNAFAWRWNAQVFAARGYVVAWHNFHGSSGFGQAFTDSINPNQDRLPYVDTIKAAEYLLAQPWADGERIVAAGASYGGYLASILLGREHPFKTIVAHAAVFNWYTQYGSDFGFNERRFGDFWDQPEIFKESSPHYGAANFKTPTLVIHGQLDYRVPVNHGLELFHILQRQGVKSRLIYFPNENHWILKPQNSIFWYQQVFDWIDDYAAPGPK